MQRIDWCDYRSIFPHYNGHHVVGHLRVAQQVHSPQLGNQRDVVVYLPPSYAYSDRRYPVLYMHDGQNLFDNAASFAGEWGVDEAMETLSAQSQLEGIVVGVPNLGEQRLNEYSPFVDAKLGGGRGAAYVAFLAETLKPLIDAHFRTRTERQATGIMGSSMGGLISLYAFFERGDVFGFAGVMSPSLWFANGAIYNYVETAVFQPGKIYLDAGTRELGGGSWPQVIVQRAQSRSYYASVRRMKRVLANKGYRPVRDLLHVEEKWANHNESAWARRMPLALRFFLTEARREPSG